MLLLRRQRDFLALSPARLAAPPHLRFASFLY